MKIAIQKPCFKDEISGRVVKPSVPITSNKFEYVPACKTDLRETFRKARERIQREGGK
jgi:hypothetical protein